MTDDQDEISLLDIAVFAAENWLLLIFLPLAVAVGTFAWASNTAPTYTATIELGLPDPGDDARSPYVTPAFYEATIAERDGVEIEVTASGAAIATQASSQDAAIERAQSAYADIAAPVIAAAQGERDTAMAVIATASNAIELIQSEVDEDPAAALTLLEMQSALVPFQERLSEATAVIEALQTPPAAEAARAGRSAVLYAALAALATGLVLLVLLALRQGMRAAAATSEGREKLRRIADALLLRRAKP